MPYSIILVEGVRINVRRGIAFLESEEDKRMDGKKVYEKLKEKNKRDLLRSSTIGWAGASTTGIFMDGPTRKSIKSALFSSGNRLEQTIVFMVS